MDSKLLDILACPLCKGPLQWHRDPQLLVECINHYGISTLHFVPSMLQVFLQDEQVGTCTGLKQFVHSLIQEHGGVGQYAGGHGIQKEKSLNTSGISPCMASASWAS